MPRIDHAALWVSDLAGARDFYVGWFAGRSNGEYHNPATGLRTFIITFEPDHAGEASNGRSARLELMSRPDIAASRLLPWIGAAFGMFFTAGAVPLSPPPPVPTHSAGPMSPSPCPAAPMSTI